MWGNWWDWRTQHFLRFSLNLRLGGFFLTKSFKPQRVNRVSSRERRSCYKACRYLKLVFGIYIYIWIAYIILRVGQNSHDTSCICKENTLIRITILIYTYIYIHILMNTYLQKHDTVSCKFKASTFSAALHKSFEWLRASFARQRFGNPRHLAKWRRSRLPWWLGLWFQTKNFSDFTKWSSQMVRARSHGNEVWFSLLSPYDSIDSPTAAVVNLRKSFDRLLQTSQWHFKSRFSCGSLVFHTIQLSTYLRYQMSTEVPWVG